MMITARKLTKQYGSTRVLSDLSLSIEPGEFIALLGANGTGKSTLIRCILGLTGFRGDLHVTGLDPRSSGAQVRSRIGYMPQSGSLHTDMCVEETMRFYASFRNITVQECDELLAAVQLLDYRKRLVGHLSGGLQQRLSFAVSRLGDPRLMLLDEPTAGLDAESRKVLAAALQAVHAAGTTIVMTTHVRSDVASLASRAITLENGSARDVPVALLSRMDEVFALEVF